MTEIMTLLKDYTSIAGHNYREQLHKIVSSASLRPNYIDEKIKEEKEMLAKIQLLEGRLLKLVIRHVTDVLWANSRCVKFPTKLQAYYGSDVSQLQSFIKY